MIDYEREVLNMSEQLFQTLIRIFMFDHFCSISEDGTWENGLNRFCSQKIKQDRRSNYLEPYRKFRNLYLSESEEDLLQTIDLTFSYSLLAFDLKEHWRYPDESYKRLRESLTAVKNKNRNEGNHTTVQVKELSETMEGNYVVAFDEIRRLISTLRMLEAEEDFIWDLLTKKEQSELNKYDKQAKKFIAQLTSKDSQEPKASVSYGIFSQQINVQQNNSQNNVYFYDRKNENIMNVQVDLIKNKAMLGLADSMMQQGRAAEAEKIYRDILDNWDSGKYQSTSHDTE